MKADTAVPIESTKLPNLLFCIGMDAIGLASNLIPGIGEISDVLWAPISAYIFRKSFGGKVGTIGSIINFLEEIFPYTDFIPTFTLAYFYVKYFYKEKEIDSSPE